MSAAFDRRQLAALSPDERQTVAHALDVAAQRFEENARTMRDEAVKARDPNRPLEERAAPVSTAAGYERLAEQFDRQAAAARALYPRFADC